MMKNAELLFVPVPAMGHIVPILEFAKLLLDRDDRFSVTVLLMKMPLFEHDAVNDYINSFSTSVLGRLRFHHLPQLDPNLLSTPNSKALSPVSIFCSLISQQKPLVKDAIKQLTQSESTQLTGFVFDMLCTSMVDVADALGVPSYVFFAPSAAFLGFLFHLQTLHDCQGVDVAQLADSAAELVIPSFAKPVPSQVLPSGMAGGVGTLLLNYAREMRAAKGILVNTFVELESHAIDSLVRGTTIPIYPVGPILNLKCGEHLDNNRNTMGIMNWLDNQPRASVVFLCFGSIGFFSLDQIKQIAEGLERSGHRFLWSLRKPPSEGGIFVPGDYMNSLEQVLPGGFLDRTTEKGKVIGWAPQLAVLAHPSIGGFISHCGWNSVLESIWSGVPVATWPIYSEQQLNAFEMVKELGLAVEIKLDYKYNNGKLVSAEEIENGIKKLMDVDGKVRRKLENMRERSMNALIDGGSSNVYLERFIEDVISNIA